MYMNRANVRTLGGRIVCGRKGKGNWSDKRKRLKTFKKQRGFASQHYWRKKITIISQRYICGDGTIADLSHKTPKEIWKVSASCDQHAWNSWVGRVQLQQKTQQSNEYYYKDDYRQALVSLLPSREHLEKDAEGNYQAQDDYRHQSSQLFGLDAWLSSNYTTTAMTLHIHCTEIVILNQARTHKKKTVIVIERTLALARETGRQVGGHGSRHNAQFTLAWHDPSYSRRFKRMPLTKNDRKDQLHVCGIARRVWSDPMQRKKRVVASCTGLYTNWGCWLARQDRGHDNHWLVMVNTRILDSHNSNQGNLNKHLI